jgi:hypothetical protein
MSSPEYSGTIEFPARFLDDEIKDCIVAHYPADIALGDVVGLGDVEVEIYHPAGQEKAEGIFRFHDSEARYGEFDELEKLLEKKRIPYDRESGMDWNAPACIRIYRPGPPEFLHIDANPDGYEQVVSVHKLREIINDTGFTATERMIALKRYLAERFPPYSPLSSFVGVALADVGKAVLPAELQKITEAP